MVMIRIGFSVWLVGGYTHVFRSILSSVIIVTLLLYCIEKASF